MTASGDRLRQLFRSFAKRDDDAFRVAAEGIIEDERARNHRLLADDLQRLLLQRNGRNAEVRSLRVAAEVPKDRERGFPLVDISHFDYNWDRLIIPAKTTATLQQLAHEHHRRDVLAAYGLRPKQRILFFGPPGCGKTLAAKVLAGVLGIPLVTTRFDAIVSSYLGETAANLRRVFDFVAHSESVVLFDEFDAIGKERDNPFEHGELKRVVSALLQLMDAFQGESILVAATNHEGMLDRAVWRRFEQVLSFGRPSEHDRVLMLRLFLGGFRHPDLDLTEAARKLRNATGADIEWVSLEAARRSVLEGSSEIRPADFGAAVAAFQDRVATLRSAGEDQERDSIQPTIS